MKLRLRSGSVRRLRKSSGVKLRLSVSVRKSRSVRKSNVSVKKLNVRSVRRKFGKRLSVNVRR